MFLLVCIGSFLGSRGAFPNGSSGKEFTCNAGDTGKPGSVPKKIPWRRKWQPSPVFLPEKSHGQRSLMGYRPRVHKGSHTTELLSKQGLVFFFFCGSRSSCCALAFSGCHAVSQCSDLSYCRAGASGVAASSLLETRRTWGWLTGELTHFVD